MERQIIEGKRERPVKAAVATQAMPTPQVQWLTVDEESAGQRLDNFLMRVLKGVPKTHVHRVIRSGEVRINKGRVHSDTRVQAGDTVRLPPVRMAPVADTAHVVPREFPVLLEDELMLAINKPAGVAVHGGSGVSFGVIEQLRRARPEARFLELVHRLDRDTSGILLLAKKRSALVNLQDQLRERSADKTYATLATGHVTQAHQVVDVPLHKYLTAEGERRVRTSAAGDATHAEAKRSISLVRLVRHCGPYSLLDVTIKTGRTHQIRVHLAHIGHPIVGDDKYGDFALNKALAKGEGGLKHSGMLLHAKRLAFTHPGSGERIELLSPMPASFQPFLNLPAT